MAWNEQPPKPGDDRPGCLDAIVLTRMAFGILFWPVAAVMGAAVGVTAFILLLASYPLQTAGGTVVLVVGATAAWRWINTRRPPPAG
ncbi:MAG: hypothetical protein EPO22_06520 [Dehalococcoidia bacterium]|nr:MAG: hypothetical protein EPO22_06520 [Dehalococcoidia bacterium]